MQRPGHVVFTLRPGEALTHVPANLDLLSGAARAASHLDGGPIDRALGHRGDGFRAAAVFHARRSLHVPGEQHVGFDAVEEELGLSRTYRAQLGDPAATRAVVDRLRGLPVVESVAVQSLATAPFALPGSALAGRALPGNCLRAEGDPHDMVRATEALELEPGDERVTVACVDSGIALGHPELQRKILAGYDTVDLGTGPIGKDIQLLGDSRGRDFCPADAVGHGTAVAGIIGAQGWRIRKGAAGLSLILPLRVLAAARSPRSRFPIGVGALPDIDAGMKVAVDLGAQVINMSFGTPADALPEGSPTPHRAVVAYAAHYGCVLVAASGNSGRRERFYPATLPGVIAVSSIDRSGRRSAFSTWGDHVALAAPGEQILSADRHGYRAASGTSFAAPFVAAAAALCLARGRRRNIPLRPDDVREVLTSSAQSLGPAPNPETGAGLVDIAAAIRLVDQRANAAGLRFAPGDRGRPGQTAHQRPARAASQERNHGDHV